MVFTLLLFEGCVCVCVRNRKRCNENRILEIFFMCKKRKGNIFPQKNHRNPRPWLSFYVVRFTFQAMKNIVAVLGVQRGTWLQSTWAHGFWMFDILYCINKFQVCGVYLTKRIRQWTTRILSIKIISIWNQVRDVIL